MIYTNRWVLHMLRGDVVFFPRTWDHERCWAWATDRGMRLFHSGKWECCGPQFLLEQTIELLP